jgi:type II secretory pathway pseudopilin PulG
LVEIMIAVSLIGLLASISVPSMVRARENSNLNVIRANVRQIDNVKQQWALETRAAPGSTPVDNDLQAYFKGNKMPDPVLGEVYNINALGEPASAVLSCALGPYPAGTAILAQ